MSSEQELLDAAFLPLGVSAQPRRTLARHYRGTLGGHPLEIYCTREVRRSSTGTTPSYQGHLLEISVSAPLRTRLVYGTSSELASWINRRFKLQPVDVPPPGFGDYRLFALDERWARDFLGDREIEAALRVVLADDEHFGLFSVQVRPQALALLLRTDLANLTPDHVRRWVEASSVMADIATRLHPPSKLVQASGWEKWSQSNRHLMPWVGAGAFLLVIAALGLVASGCCLAALLLQNLA